MAIDVLMAGGAGECSGDLVAGDRWLEERMGAPGLSWLATESGSLSGDLHGVGEK